MTWRLCRPRLPYGLATHPISLESIFGSGSSLDKFCPRWSFLQSGWLPLPPQSRRLQVLQERVTRVSEVPLALEHRLPGGDRPCGCKRNCPSSGPELATVPRGEWRLRTRRVSRDRDFPTLGARSALGVRGPPSPPWSPGTPFSAPAPESGPGRGGAPLSPTLAFVLLSYSFGFSRACGSLVRGEAARWPGRGSKRTSCRSDSRWEGAPPASRLLPRLAAQGKPPRLRPPQGLFSSRRGLCFGSAAAWRRFPPGWSAQPAPHSRSSAIAGGEDR